MHSTLLDWKPNEKLAVGQGATMQQFVASLGADRSEIDVMPRGEGYLSVDGQELVHVDDS